MQNLFKNKVPLPENMTIHFANVQIGKIDNRYREEFKKLLGIQVANPPPRQRAAAAAADGDDPDIVQAIDDEDEKAAFDGMVNLVDAVNYKPKGLVTSTPYTPKKPKLEPTSFTKSATLEDYLRGDVTAEEYINASGYFTDDETDDEYSPPSKRTRAKTQKGKGRVRTSSGRGRLRANKRPVFRSRRMWQMVM